MVPGERPIMYIDYKYNMQKVLSFIATEDAGSTKAGISYLSKYPDPFATVSIQIGANNLVMSKLFVYVNEVKSHNKSRQSYIALEKYGVTQCGWLQSCTPAAMGMTITNCWKLVCDGGKRDHH